MGIMSFFDVLETSFEIDLSIIQPQIHILSCPLTPNLGTNRIE